MEAKRQHLKRNKTIACGLMVCAAILFVVARCQKGEGWEWVAAFAEAAMVGALADWFAVVALFRHPLGIPIPHTAIIPNKKNTIAQSLAQFIHDKFLAADALVAKLKEINPAEHLCTYLISKHNADSLAAGICRVIGESVDFLDDERVSNVLSAALKDRAEKFDLAASAGALIDALRKDNRHQAVLDDLLRRLGGWITTEEAQHQIATFIDNWLSAEYPMLSMFLPNRDQFAKGAGEKVAKKVNDFIQEVNADSSHALRHKFDGNVAEFGTRLKNEHALRVKIDDLKREALNNAQLSDYAKGLATDVKDWLVNDLERPHSEVKKKIAEIALGVGNTLSRNKELKDSINDHLVAMVRNHAGTLQKEITSHISGTINQWEDKEFVEEIELSIGSDLQFIRMNGTLVGGMIGLLLHAVTLLLK
jgi:uncharacterized membrane-anchored protein YjiN (DUF445 family)